jgi:hypothetical protein
VRIGLIASPWIPVPPPRYGGTEAVVDNLARGLRDAGHDVDLFTIGESRCDVNRSWIFQHAIEDLNNSMYEAIHVEAAYRSLTNVDIIHDHTTIGPLLGSHAAPAGVPVVTTAHGPFHTTARQMYSRLPDRCCRSPRMRMWDSFRVPMWGREKAPPDGFRRGLGRRGDGYVVILM